MKFIHIADIHLGATPDSDKPWGQMREKEIWDSLHHIIEKCNEEGIDLLLIAGDLFHKQPLVRELKELHYYFSKLKDTQVVIIAGNHDYVGVRSNYSGFEWNSHVHMLRAGYMDVIYLDELNTFIYGMSYSKRDITEAIYDQVRPSDDEGIHVLLAHGGDEKTVPMNRRRMQNLGFDYIALGHIHKPEVFSESMAYSGCLEPLHKNEVGERGYIFGEIIKKNKDYETKIKFIPSSIRQYKRIRLISNKETTNRALYDQAKEVVTVEGGEHIYSFIIEGVREPELIFDKDLFYDLGHVLEVHDYSAPDYDFDALYRENRDNIIGLFIEKIREDAKESKVAKKALYYGIEALLGAKTN